MIEVSNIPNLDQSFFGNLSTLGNKKASKKNTADTIVAQTRILSELINGYRATIKNTIDNKIPKYFSDDRSIEI